MNSKKTGLTAVLLAVSIVMTFGIAYFVAAPTEVIPNEGLGSNKSASYFNKSMNSYLSSVIGLENRLTLPYDTSPAPKASAENFKKVTLDGVKKEIYEDSTISVTVWKEKLTRKVNGKNCTSEFAFADVKISDASQFRRGYAKGDPTKKGIAPPTDIFKKCNGIVGMAADFYSYRPYGYIYQYGTEVLRDTQKMKDNDLDILIVDYNGDFHSYSFRELLKKKDKEFTDNIMFSFTFGPTLVADGKNTHSSLFTNQNFGEVDHAQARACIGQLGPLHYLLCTVGETGCNMEVLADEMVARGCITAYNLDGGQSGTLLYRDKSYNKIAYSNNGKNEKYGERAQNTIIYFGTAINE